MNILFLTHYFPPEGNAPATRVSEMAKRWVQAGHKVTVITGVPSVPDGIVYEGYKNRFGLQKEIIEGIKVLRVWTWIAANRGFLQRSINFYTFMCSAIKAARKQNDIDVLIATSPQFLCGWAGSVAARHLKIPFILDLRDLWPESIVAVGAAVNPFLIRYLEKKEAQLYERADHIVTVGEGYKDKLLKKKVAEEKISIVTNGVDRNFFSPREPTSEITDKYGLAGKFVCSYTGTIGMASGLEAVLRTASILKREGRDDIRFLLVGSGATLEDLKSKAENRNLDNVIFTGLQSKEEVRDIMSASNACLIHLTKQPLFETVLPSKIFEAAAMRKPLIHGVAGYSARLVEEAKAGICITPENENELCRAVIRLADDPKLCSELGSAGEKNIAESHDFKILSERYLEILNKILNGRKG